MSAGAREELKAIEEKFLKDVPVPGAKKQDTTFQGSMTKKDASEFLEVEPEGGGEPTGDSLGGMPPEDGGTIEDSLEVYDGFDGGSIQDSLECGPPSTQNGGSDEEELPVESLSQEEAKSFGLSQHSDNDDDLEVLDGKPLQEEDRKFADAVLQQDVQDQKDLAIALAIQEQEQKKVQKQEREVAKDFAIAAQIEKDDKKKLQKQERKDRAMAVRLDKQGRPEGKRRKQEREFEEEQLSKAMSASLADQKGEELLVVDGDDDFDDDFDEGGLTLAQGAVAGAITPSKSPAADSDSTDGEMKNTGGKKRRRRLFTS